MEMNNAMSESERILKLFEALELRSEYISRIATIKECLAGESSGSRLNVWREDKSKRRPSPDYDTADEREQLRSLEFKQRKLNSAIQKANFETTIEFDGQAINLLEALELRKGLNAKIAELNKQTLDAAYQTVIYKEGRDIVESSSFTYAESRTELDQARKCFRELNRKLRQAAYETPVEYRDEEN